MLEDLVQQTERNLETVEQTKISSCFNIFIVYLMQIDD